MLSNNNKQSINQFSNGEGAFKLASPCKQFNGKSQKQCYIDASTNLEKIQKQLFSELQPKSQNYDAELWSKAQIQKLFKLYDYYGPQWKIMSQHMPLRTANNLKNRFYTVLRNLVKLLFRKMENNCPKFPGQIPSKDLSRLYDGKQKYLIYKSLISVLLHQIDFDLQSKKVDFVVKKYSDSIINVYHTIYNQKQIAQEEEQKRIRNQALKVNDDQHFHSCLMNSAIQKRKYQKNSNDKLIAISNDRPNSYETEKIKEATNIVYFVFFDSAGLFQH